MTGKKKFLNPRFYKAGKCIYPFKYKKKVYNFPDCPKSADKQPIEFCAIETGKQGGITKFGMCLPNGVTPEQYDKQVEDTIEQNKKTQKKYKIKFTGKKTVKPSLAISDSADWIAKLYTDLDFKILKTKDNGDCLFDSVRLAYNRPSITVKSLRQMVSDNLQNYHLELYKTLYNNAVANNDVEIIDETKFINGIETLSDLKDYVLTSSYWADMLSINILERLLKLKIFVFNETNYLANNYDNIINCGNNLNYAQKYAEYLKLSKNDKHHFSDTTIFDAVKPDQFILVNYETGLHYKLISYKKRKIFSSFSQLPKNLVDSLKSKCNKMSELVYFD